MNDLSVWTAFVKRPDWFDQATCRALGPGVFFTGDPSNENRGETAAMVEAKRFCFACPVRAECLAYGLEERHGIWGGRTPSERRRIRKVVAA